MMTLADSTFVQAARKSATDPYIIPTEDVKGQYREFIALTGKTAGDKHASIELLRCLGYTYIELLSVEKLLTEKRPDSAYLPFISKALLVVKLENDLVKTEIDKPDLCRSRAEVSHSPVFWSEDFPVTGLVELAISLSESGAVRLKNGMKVPLSTLVRIFEVAFNVKIPGVRSLKFNIVNRMLNFTPFLDTLRETICRLCSR